MHLDHINIRAPEELIERVRQFYCTVLGFAAGPRPEFSSPGYWLYSGQRPLVHLSTDPDRTAAGGPGHLDHVAFRAEGPDALLARLNDANIHYRRSGVPELGLTQIFLRDPAGNGLEINFAEKGEQ